MGQQKLNMSISQGGVIPTFVFASVTLREILNRAASCTTGIIFYEDNHSDSFQSYQDLLQEASSILNSLRQEGLQSQDKVILQLQNSRYFFASLWACWLGGFVPLPLGVDLSFQKDITRSKLYQAWKLCDCPVIISDIVKADYQKPWREIAVEDLLNNSPDNNYHHGTLDDLALLLFTSGSTGKPKGVMLSARNLIASIYGMAKVNNLSQQDITLNWMPLEHVASLVMFHLTEVYLECQQIQVKSEFILQNPLQWLDLLHLHRVSATWSPNFAYNLVNEQLEKLDNTINYNWDLSCVRWMGNGAEAVAGKTSGHFLELLAPYGLKPTVISPGYGMSETTSGIAHSDNFNRNQNRTLVSVGAPIPGISLRIVDRENNLIPEGETGLLQVKGETVTAGYYQQPELNEEVFTADGWFNTGDLGFLESGQLTITGRQKDTIIINGVNYYNHDLETIVESISGVNVSFTAACSVRDNNQQEQIAIFFNTEEKADKLRELINNIRGNIFTKIGVSPTYIIPVTQKSIPKTAIGKIMRSQLSQRFNAGEFNSIVAEVEALFDRRNLSQQELPGNAIEQELVALWQSVLNLSTVGVKDNFFELGGNSLLLMQVLSKLTPQYRLSVVTLFQYPTISALASYLNSDQESCALQQGKRRGELRRKATKNKDVAIIGMACRFPGANNIDQFWSNLCNGVESIDWFEDREMINSGVDRELVDNPDYVKASPILEDIAGFDANFWGFSPKEAQLLDPQQRLFLECAWESLEDAGYDSFTYQGDISLYGGAATNTYLLNNIYPNRHSIDDKNSLQVLNLSSMGGFQVSTANDKDYLTTRTSYKLNFTGSSVNVQTACSTSLVTVHLACQSLINAECDLALAGGVSVHSPQKMGYLYQEGMILSSDGHCRAFDADASGTIFGSGAGMVVLKMLDRAVEDGDRIYGVIKGSAVNNDGGTKVGYLAPNLDGQIRVIAEALAVADISPDSVGYIEAHGTGTKLGDPIEVTALAQAYHHDITKSGYCAVGSVKTNVGHLQMASGIVGLIKTVLCLDRQKIPASLHFQNPNPQLNLDRTPFYINTELQEWETNQTNNYPRRAGVNSLGIGGTNAHVVLEEFVNSKQESDRLLPAYLLTISAKDATALEELASKYQNYIYAHNDMLLRDICLTSNVGRHHFDYRRAIVAQDQPELIAKLSNRSTVKLVKQDHKIVWLFTGQGSQYVGMAQQLYDTCSAFRKNCDRCFEIWQQSIDLPIIDKNSKSPLEDFDLSQTQQVQPLLFTIEYSLAQLWLSWGIKPDVMLGHSIGEYVAASLAEVFSLADALKLVAARSKLMQSLPKNGAMLAVFGDFTPRHQDAKKDLRLDSLLAKYHNVGIAANNGSHLILSGLKEEIDCIVQALALLKIKTQLLNVSHGFHSALMQPILQDFKVVADTVDYALPKIPIVSNITGELANQSIASADYWIEHILQPVQFAKGIKYLEQQQVNIFLEIGTKPTLTAIAKSLLNNKLFLHSLDRSTPDWQSILNTLGQLYEIGIDINWQKVTQDYNANKISLPTYPFQRQRHWFDIPKVNNYIQPVKQDIVHPWLGKVISSPVKQTIFQSYINLEADSWLQDHCLKDKIIFPGAGYLEIAIALGLFHYQSDRLLIENLQISCPLYLDGYCEIQTITYPQKKSDDLEIYSLSNDRWQLHCDGRISRWNELLTGESLSSIKAKFNNTELDVQQHYFNCQQKGINYGKNFQAIEQLWAKEDLALGLIKLPNDLDSKQYHFHPALLDSCLQILFAALPQELQTNIYIPVGLDKLYTNSLPNSQVWSYLELKNTNAQTLTADVWLYNENGKLVAKLEGLKSQAVKPQSPWQSWLYQQQWKPQPLLTTTSLVNNGTWLIFADSMGVGKQVATKLESQQQQCHLITGDSIEDNPQAYLALIQQRPNLTGIIYFWSLDSTSNWEECKSYLYLVQALVQQEVNLPLWFITRDAQPVNQRQPITPDMRNACLWGMQKAIALEYPELQCVGIDLDSIDKVADSIFREVSAKENEQVAYRDDKRYVARLTKYNWEAEKQYLPKSNLQLHINHPGNLDSLEWKSISRQQPLDYEIQIEVKATGLNFRDVMVAMDLYPDETKFLGLECSGVVIAVGSRVTNFQVGDEIIAISDNSFNQYLNVNSLLAIHKPAAISFSEAATIPVTFLTTYYTLVHLAQLQPGEKILIHSAAGGVGMAAIQIAQNIGAEIYATASTPKWKLLESMGVANIMDSRSLDFAQQIRSTTGGKGVDVVLNSLSGEFIAKSIEVLNPQGRFIEIGKQGIWTKEDVAKVKPSINYSIVDLWQITQNKPELIQQMLSHLLPQFTTGKLKPLPYKIFDSNKIIDAFRYMQQGKHHGKIVITSATSNSNCDRVKSPSAHRHNPSISPSITPNSTYLIAGGMGAIGLQVAQWLITKGVKSLVLVGRNDLKPQYQNILPKIQDNTQVNCIKADITDTKQLNQVLQQIKLNLPPLKGVIHCAGITRDRPLHDLDWDDFQQVFAAKTKGAWNLHSLTAEYNLESFIMFSSAASLIGSAGQANYCAGNAFLDILAHARRSQGLPANSINWGAWEHTGLASNPQITDSLKQKGIGAIEPREGIRILERLLLNNLIQIGVIPINWNIWQQNNKPTPFYEEVVNVNTLAKNTTNYKQQLLTAIPEQRESLLIEQIIQQVGNILGIKDINKLDIELGFTELGLDSLSSVELRNKIQFSYELQLSQTVIFDYSNIRKLSNYLLSLIFNQELSTEQTILDHNLNTVAELSEQEAKNLLLEELNNLDIL